MNISYTTVFYTGKIDLQPGYNYGAPRGEFLTEDYIYFFAFTPKGVDCKSYYLGKM